MGDDAHIAALPGEVSRRCEKRSFRIWMIAFAVLAITTTTVIHAKRPVTELWYLHVAPPYWLDEDCRSAMPRHGEALAAYARRVPAFDLDCVRDRTADTVPDPDGSARYLIANTLLYIQRYRTDQAAFAPIDVIERMDLKRAADNPRVLYVAAELLFHGAAFQPAQAARYLPCAERLALRAIDLGYGDALWALTRGERTLVRYNPNMPCTIAAVANMLH